MKKKDRVIKRGRCFPGEGKSIRPHSRIKILSEDASGFVVYEASLDKKEGVCCKCGTPHIDDPPGSLKKCPTCSGDFND